MNRAVAEADRTIAVLSPDYVNALYTQSEWAAAFINDPFSETARTHRLEWQQLLELAKQSRDASSYLCANK